MFTRREWLAATAQVAAALPLGLSAAQRPPLPRVNGVRMALQSASFSFSGQGVPEIIRTMTDLGLGEIDIMSEHIEHQLGAPGIQLPGAGRPGPWTRPAGAEPPRPPQAGVPGGPVGSGPGAASGAAAAGAPRPPFRGMDPAVREALRAWRLSVDLDKFRAVARSFADAGLSLFSYNLSFNDAWTDAEIERGMLMTKALGTDVITASSPLTVLPRVAPLAEKHGIRVAIHNHREGPEDFAKATALSKNIWINLDAGHFFAMGHDPLAYLRQHHARITNLHVKDRMANAGREMPFGEGQTPLAELLRLVRDQRYDIPVCIEYVGPDGPQVELRRCLDYCKKALA